MADKDGNMNLKKFLAATKASKYGLDDSHSWHNLGEVFAQLDPGIQVHFNVVVNTVFKPILKTQTDVKKLKFRPKSFVAKQKRLLQDALDSDEGINYVELKASIDQELREGHLEPIIIKKKPEESLGVVVAVSPRVSFMGWSSEQYVIECLGMRFEWQPNVKFISCSKFRRRPDGRMSVAQEAGLKRRDVLVRVDGVRVSSHDEFMKCIKGPSGVHDCMHWEVVRINPLGGVSDSDYEMTRRAIVEEVIAHCVLEAAAIAKWSGKDKDKKSVASRTIMAMRRSIKSRKKKSSSGERQASPAKEGEAATGTADQKISESAEGSKVNEAEGSKVNEEKQTDELLADAAAALHISKASSPSTSDAKPRKGRKRRKKKSPKRASSNTAGDDASAYSPGQLSDHVRGHTVLATKDTDSKMVDSAVATAAKKVFQTAFDAGNGPGKVTVVDPPESSRTYSSALDGSCRLSTLQESSSAKSGWRAAAGDADEWLTMDLGTTRKVAGILTKCVPGGDRLSFRVQLSKESSTGPWVRVDKSRVFSPQESVGPSYFRKAVRARWLRLSDVQRKPDTAVSVGLLVAGRDRAQSNYNNEQYIANVMSLLESESAQTEVNDYLADMDLSRIEELVDPGASGK